MIVQEISLLNDDSCYCDSGIAKTVKNRVIISTTNFNNLFFFSFNYK